MNAPLCTSKLSDQQKIGGNGFAPVSPDTRQNELINVANQVFDKCP